MIIRMATLVAAMMAVSAVFATESSKSQARRGPLGQSWTLNVGIAMPTGDHDELGFNNMFMIGLDYMLGSTGYGSTTTTHVGAAFIGGNGDLGLDSRTWGVHYGIIAPLGEGGGLPLKVKLQGGYYNTELSNGDKEDKSGFGGMIALMWAPPNNRGSGFTIELGMYFMPEVLNVDNTGWYIAVGFPFRS